MIQSRLIICLLVLFNFLSCSSVDTNVLKKSALEKYPIDKPFPESEFIRVDGARIHIRQWKANIQNGEQAKGIVFLVHGVSGSTFNWRFLVPALVADGWDVLTADLPPFGFSGEKQPNSLALDPLPADSSSRANLLWHLFDTIYKEYNGSVILVGHSLGGRIASLMALSKPEKVSSLVLLAPAVYGSSAIPKITKYWPFNRVVFPGAEIGLGNMGVFRRVTNTASGKRVSNEELIGNWAPFLRAGVPEACAEWTIKSIDNEAPAVQNIIAPTLIFWSKYDPIVLNRGNHLQNQIPNSVYIEILGRSHCILETDSIVVNREMIKFLNQKNKN